MNRSIDFILLLHFGLISKSANGCQQAPRWCVVRSSRHMTFTRRSLVIRLAQLGVVMIACIGLAGANDAAPSAEGDARRAVQIRHPVAMVMAGYRLYAGNERSGTVSILSIT